MFGLTIGKLIALVLVILAVWRGFKMLQRMQEPQQVKRGAPGGKASAEPQTAAAVELVACPQCGLYIPKSRPCPGPQHCIHRPAG